MDVRWFSPETHDLEVVPNVSFYPKNGWSDGWKFDGAMMEWRSHENAGDDATEDNRRRPWLLPGQAEGHLLFILRLSDGFTSTCDIQHQIQGQSDQFRPVSHYWVEPPPNE